MGDEEHGITRTGEEPQLLVDFCSIFFPKTITSIRVTYYISIIVRLYHQLIQKSQISCDALPIVAHPLPYFPTLIGNSRLTFQLLGLAQD
nr:MAG TPA: hypothetical protein [Caudoviricetes sp.]